MSREGPGHHVVFLPKNPTFQTPEESTATTTTTAAAETTTTSSTQSTQAGLLAEFVGATQDDVGCFTHSNDGYVRYPSHHEAHVSYHAVQQHPQPTIAMYTIPVTATVVPQQAPKPDPPCLSRREMAIGYNFRCSPAEIAAAPMQNGENPLLKALIPAGSIAALGNPDNKREPRFIIPACVSVVESENTFPTAMLMQVPWLGDRSYMSSTGQVATCVIPTGSRSYGPNERVISLMDEAVMRMVISKSAYIGVDLDTLTADIVQKLDVNGAAAFIAKDGTGAQRVARCLFADQKERDIAEGFVLDEMMLGTLRSNVDKAAKELSKYVVPVSKSLPAMIEFQRPARSTVAADKAGAVNVKELMNEITRTVAADPAVEAHLYKLQGTVSVVINVRYFVLQ